MVEVDGVGEMVGSDVVSGAVIVQDSRSLGAGRLGFSTEERTADLAASNFFFWKAMRRFSLKYFLRPRMF